MTQKNIDLLSPEQDAELREFLCLLALHCRSTDNLIYLGTPTYQFLVDRGGVVVVEPDICKGTARDTVTLNLHGVRFMASTYGRRLTTEEFEAAVAAQREKL